MEIETKIALGFLFTFVAGLITGWYVTWQKYHQEEEKRRAVANAINHERVKTPPKTAFDRFVEILANLNKTGIDEYRIVYDDCVFIMTTSEEPKEGEL